MALESAGRLRYDKISSPVFLLYRDSVLLPSQLFSLISLGPNMPNRYILHVAVGYIGELNDLILTPNPDEVEQLFSVPLADLLDKNKWVIRDFSTPVFTGETWHI